MRLQAQNIAVMGKEDGLADKVWEIFVPWRNCFYFDNLCYEAHFKALFVVIYSRLNRCLCFISLPSEQLIDSA